MKSLRTFIPAILLSVLVLVSVWFYTRSLTTLYYVLILSLLEISLSFDNAVVNAKVLIRLTPVWRTLFLWIGLPIAVFGMRLIFPLLMVYLTTSLSFHQVIYQAIYQPSEYAMAVTSGMPLIAGFGASFLLMVFISFLFEAKESGVHWIKFLEQNALVRQLHKFPISAGVFGLLFCLFIWLITNRETIAISSFFGVLAHQCLHLLNKILGSQKTAKNTFMSGLIGFCYLEVLDASFSFDGVLGAFAITQDILIIFAGLGIGALFVRSMTIYLVKHRVLAKFKYLDHGAHYAIGFLAIMLFVKIFLHMPEWIVALVSIMILLASIVHSKLDIRLDNKLENKLNKK